MRRVFQVLGLLLLKIMIKAIFTKVTEATD